MQVLNIQNNYNNKYSYPTFGNWIRRVEKVKENGTRVLSHYNTTSFFRADFGWKNGVDYLVEKYKNIPKANVYCYGCSNGSEVYSLLMRLKSNYDNETFEKFTPVYAKDFDSVAIAEAKRETLPISMYELKEIEMFTNGKMNDFFERNSTYDHWADTYFMTLIPEIRNKVTFEQADILKDYKNINPNNSVIFARNFWVYLSDEDRITLAKNLYEHLGENSVLVLGSHDNIDGYRGTPLGPLELLKKVGFKQIDPLETESYIFVK